MKSFNIILANTPIDNGNRGCVALTMATAYLVDKVFSEQGINYHLYILDSNLENVGLYNLNLQGKDIEVYPFSYPIGVGLKDWVKPLLNIPEFFKSIKIFFKADYILDIGQGDSFADIYGFHRFSEINRIHRLANFFRKPYCMLPQTIGPFTNLIIRKKANKSIKNANMVMVRDANSLSYVRECVPKQLNIREYIDVAFFLPYKKTVFDSTKIHVGLNVSALLWNGGYTRNNQFGLKCNYQKAIRNIINYFLTIDNVIIHLIPHVVDKQRNIENDYEVCYDLYEEFNNNRIVLSPFFLSPIDAKNYISGMDFFLGARMHSTIAAFSSSVPVIPMSYSRKFNGLFKDTLSYDYFVDMKEMGESELLDVIKEGFANRVKIRKVIMERMVNIVEERKRQLLFDLTNLLCNENR